MGSMSASDAAPLPRLGEVYFDVRGESRSMRLSWYADTGVAVFSIWQGGTCTGTFRLPIADLPRMVEALQRGPHGDARGDARGPRDARGTTEQHGRGDQRGGQPREYLDPPGQGHRGEPATAAYREDQGGEHRRTGAYGRYDEEEARQGYGEDSLPGGYRGEPGSGYPAPGGYEDEPAGVYRGDVPSHDYQDEPGARYREADYPGDPLTGRYPVADPHPSGYPESDPRPQYQDDPLTGRYHEDPRPSRYPEEDPRTARYPEQDPHTARYPEEDPHTARYPEDPLTGDHPDGPHTGDYPAGPAGAGYPEDTAGYPASSGNAGYSPARPYVAPVPGGTGPAAEGRGHGHRRAADREESDLSPDSFPYGRPPAEPEPRRRGT
jgi:hypothetical protein